jgi:predicted transcriptional regulator
MIVRILGEGQFVVAEEALAEVNRLDDAVAAAVEAGDEERFRSALTALLEAVRRDSTPHDAESLDESDVILPMADASIEEVREMLADDGLIPG